MNQSAFPNDPKTLKSHMKAYAKKIIVLKFKKKWLISLLSYAPKNYTFIYLSSRKYIDLSSIKISPTTRKQVVLTLSAVESFLFMF